MAKRVDLSLSEKVKLVSELQLPGVTQASVSKKYSVEISRAGAIVAENEREKARKRMLGLLCFCGSNRN